MAKEELDIEHIRSTYREAIEDESIAEDLWELTKDYEGNDGRIWAYKGSARSLMARFHWNPYHKFSYLKEAMEHFEQATKHASGHPEVHFLRFAVQHYTPEFLGLSRHLRKDKKAILAGLMDHEHFQIKKEEALHMLEFLRESNRCSERELENLEVHMLGKT